ncbi:hypothetical protein Sme01_65350 [Sphaerisporangium melleum]|uniref:Methyltransferase n=1 Tax=Sphaerisporangium melleum TaxID=321316 RepID=A0A917VP39_9ACTN|nr:class I SAM-dependent methyltransferase [Sphaerisporangium melleum]GGL03457.1 hypothetical protein GCM10007964_51950 [Sphaerisporangium melleum]GII74059.1 hypothetical protein Sme01_65350 [Sphaerisporangium melleum]
MRTLSPRHLLIFGAALTAAAVIALVSLSAAGAVEPIAAAGLAVSLLVLATAAVTAAALRRTDGKALRIDARTKRQEASLARAEQSLARLTATVEGLTGRLADAAREQSRPVLAALGEDRVELTAQAARVERLAGAVTRVEKAVTALGGSVRDGHKELARSARQDYAQLEALIDLRALLRPRAPLPRLRGWAASPDVLRLLVERVAAEHPKIIVECGSGASSVWLGYAVQRFGGGRVVALEHDERYAEASRDLVLAHELQDVVEIRHAPLVPWSPAGAEQAESFPWYDTRAVEDLHGIGLVFVDGPPGATGPFARYPALPVLLPRCAQDAWFVMDDTARADEREITDRWLREHPELTGAAHPAEKGAIILKQAPR